MSRDEREGTAVTKRESCCSLVCCSMLAASEARKDIPVAYDCTPSHSREKKHH